MKKIFICLFAFLLITFSLKSQTIVDRIIATIGNEIILESEVENQYIQLLSQKSYSDDGDLKCDILEELMFNKLLLLQADIDSVTVTDKDVSNELDRRLDIYIAQLGSEKKLEEYLGKSISEIKNDFVKIIHDQMLTQKVQSALTDKVKISPSDVRKSFESIPKDSLPVISAYTELAEIVIKPQIGKTEKDETIKKLNEIRDRILMGEKFATLAVLYSEDPGSAVKGGELGFVSRNDLVPEFASVGFSLSNTTDISRVVETEYGFHIIQLIEKRGNIMNFRHILLTPKVSIAQIELSEQKADSIYSLIEKKEINFDDAVMKYSDSETKFNGGKVTNAYIGSSKLTDEVIDPATRRAIAELTVGEYSKPYLTTDTKGVKIFKIIKVTNKVDEHVANLKDDYQDIQEFAKQKENQKVIENWIKQKIDNTFIKIDNTYRNCNFKFANWTKNQK
ncbi:MAG: peptidylprolyl isomerase [Bacteroidales bacterium]|jgi:peptidyl-prolyl cis-trans isomerase SurA|nr:peptidylprolyl isomerase [Bacteroidales bacterium]